MINRIGILFGVGCLAALYAGSAGAQEDPAYMKQLYDKAVSSGQKTITVYSPFPGMPGWLDEFSASYPEIKVVHQVLGAAQMTTRLEAERTSGNHAGDIGISGLILLGPLNDQGFFEAYQPKSSAGLDPNLRTSDGNVSIPFINLFALDYNTQLVSESDLPKSFAELFSGKWKGQIGYSNMANSGASEMCGTLLWKNGRLTREDLQGLKDNGVGFKANTEVSVNLAQGRVSFGLWSPSHSTKRVKRDGAPVDVGYVRDMACTFGAGAGLIKDAPNPDAAKLLLEWLFSAEGQKAATGPFSAYGTMPGAGKPEGYPDISDLNLTPIKPAELAKDLADFRKITQEIWTN